jgi:hypothetical protein
MCARIAPENPVLPVEAAAVVEGAAVELDPMELSNCCDCANGFTY